jgi:hypothetical protein
MQYSTSGRRGGVVGLVASRVERSGKASRANAGGGLGSGGGNLMLVAIALAVGLGWVGRETVLAVGGGCSPTHRGASTSCQSESSNSFWPVILRPTFPTHLVVHFVDCSVKEVQVCLHHAAGLLSRVPENAFPLLEPCRLNLILDLVWSILLVLLDEDCHRKHIALGGNVPRVTTGIADEAGIVLPSIQGRTNEAST